jgi:lipid A 3-O-deacylase PagL
MISLTVFVHLFPSICKPFRTFPTLSGLLLTLLLMPSLPESSWGHEIDIVGIGIRGGLNFADAELPPPEKEDFQQYDVIGIIGLPWKWEYPSSGWEVRSRVNGSAGVLRGAGDNAFITTITPGLAFRKPSWRLILDIGVGGALLTDWEFGRLDAGGPFQFIAHGGVSFELPWNLVLGWQFHHMSDATIYGKSQGVDLHMLELSYYFGDD